MSSATKNKKYRKPDDRLLNVIKQQQEQKGNDEDDENYYVDYVATDESLKVDQESQKEEEQYIPVKIIFSTSCQYYCLSILMAVLCPGILLLGIIPISRNTDIQVSSKKRDTLILITSSVVIWMLLMTFVYPRRIEVLKDGSVRVVMWLFLTFRFHDIHEAFSVEWPKDLHKIVKRDAIRFSTSNSSRVIVSRNHQRKDLWVSPNLQDRDEFVRAVNEITKDVEYVYVDDDEEEEDHGCVNAQAKPTFLHFYEIDR
jgi:hypothetical protein